MEEGSDGIWLSRAEIELKPGGRTINAHIYEGYWAPMTEGKIKVRGVIDFLRTAGLQGVKNGSNGFRRWAFGESYRIDTVSRHIFYLLLALLVVVALVVMNLAIVMVAASKSLFEEPPKWFSDNLIQDLTTTFNIVVTVLAAFVATLVVAYSLRWLQPKLGGAAESIRGVSKTWSALSLPVFLLSLAVVILGGVAIVVLFYGHVNAGASTGAGELWPSVVSARVLDAFNAGFDQIMYDVLRMVGIGLLGLKALKVLRAVYKDLKSPNPFRLLSGLVVLGWLILLSGAAVFTVSKQQEAVRLLASPGRVWRGPC
jgi:hypothetical protein